MKRFSHRNIVGLLGVCFDTPEGYPYLVLPFMTNGNIRDYLRERRVHETDTASIPDVRAFFPIHLSHPLQHAYIHPSHPAIVACLHLSHLPL